ncbi:class II aldolase/adducin-like protein [Caballeronia peredens]|nr:class II aldolase/adducin-like protein [Caballeronia peredens]
MSSIEATSAQQAIVRMAARALGRAGLVHAYGHCSLRLDRDYLLVCAPMPMGLIEKEAGVVVPIRGALPDGVLGEVRIHQQIYARRDDVGAVVRSMPPSVMSLSTAGITPVPRHGPGAYFAPAAPLWNDVQLVRSTPQAEGVADTLGKARAIVMRGNGAVVVGATLEEAVACTWFLEDAARVEFNVRTMRLEEASTMSAEDAEQRATTSGRVIERMWEYLSAGDPELEAFQP